MLQELNAQRENMCQKLGRVSSLYWELREVKDRAEYGRMASTIMVRDQDGQTTDWTE